MTEPGELAIIRGKKNGGALGPAFVAYGKWERTVNILAFANQKGGVGKTTSAINVAACLGALGKKVLLVDLDPQGNTTSGVGIDKKSPEITTFEVLVDGADLRQAVLATAFPGLWIVPANMELAGAELSLAENGAREQALKRALSAVEEAFDYVLVDCPPSLGLLTLNGLVAAARVMVPMQCEYFALEGLSQLIYTVNLVKKRYNPALEVGGILLTMYDGRLNLSLAVAAELKKHFPQAVFQNTVPRNVRLSEAPSHGKPVIYYDKYSKGARAYEAIARELLERGI